MQRYGFPVKIFYVNMLKIGITISAENGRLKVSGNREAITPVIKEEIIKRSEQLVDLLTPAPSPEMASCFGRLLTLDELTQALHTAELLRERVDSYPLDGGWLLVTSKWEKP